MDKSNVQFYLVKIPIIAGLVLIVAAAGMYKLGLLEAEALLPWIAAGLATIAGDLLIYSFSRDKERELRDREKEATSKSTTEIIQALTNIEQTCTAKIRSIEAPSDNEKFFEEYIELWGGFETGIYSAFNPAYRIEVLRSNIDEIVERVFVRRFQTEQFKEARYLFLLKDDEDKKNYDVFRDIVRKAKDKCPEVSDKLHVWVREDAAAKDYPEFYVGIRRGKDTCIIEPAPSDKVLTRQRGKRGLPLYYFVTNDTTICKAYTRWFEDEFQDESVRKVDLNEIFSQSIR
jgi:hypothetical protein